MQQAAPVTADQAQAILGKLSEADGKAAARLVHGQAAIALACARLVASGMSLEQAWTESVRVCDVVKAEAVGGGGLATLVQLKGIGVPPAQLQQHLDWMAWVHGQLKPPSGRPLQPFEGWRAVEDAAKALIVDARRDPKGLPVVAQAILGGASTQEAMAALPASLPAAGAADAEGPVLAGLQAAGVPPAQARELLALMKAAAGPGTKLPDAPPSTGGHAALPAGLVHLARHMPSYQLHEQADMAPAVRKAWHRLAQCLALVLGPRREAVRAQLPLDVRASLFCVCSDRISQDNQKKSARLQAVETKASGGAPLRKKDILPPLSDVATLALMGQLFGVKDFDTVSSTTATARFESRVRPRMEQAGSTWQSMSDAQCQALMREVFRAHQAAFGYGETSLRFAGAAVEPGASSASAQTQADTGPAPGIDPRELQMGYYHPQTQTVSVQLWDDAPGGRVRRPLPLVFEGMVHELTHRHQHELAFRYLGGQVGPSDDAYQTARIMAGAAFTNPVESMLRAHGVDDASTLDEAYRLAPAEQEAFAAGEQAAGRLRAWLAASSEPVPSQVS